MAVLKSVQSTVEDEEGKEKALGERQRGKEEHASLLLWEVPSLGSPKAKEILPGSLTPLFPQAYKKWQMLTQPIQRTKEYSELEQRAKGKELYQA